jgi:hypothetical protein
MSEPKDTQNLEIEALSDDDLESVSGGVVAVDPIDTSGGSCDSSGTTCSTSGGTCHSSGGKCSTSGGSCGA